MEGKTSYVCHDVFFVIDCSSYCWSKEDKLYMQALLVVTPTSWLSTLKQCQVFQRLRKDLTHQHGCLILHPRDLSLISMLTLRKYMPNHLWTSKWSMILYIFAVFFHAHQQFGCLQILIILFAAAPRTEGGSSEDLTPICWPLEECLGHLLDTESSSFFHCRRNEVLVKQLSSPAPDAEDLSFPTKYAQSFWQQCLACSWKQHCSYWRNPLYNVVRLLFTIICALLLGSIFWGLGHNR